MNTENLKNASSKKRVITGNERLLFVDPKSAKKGTTSPIDYIEISELGGGLVENGLTKSGNVTKLGGALTENTSIDTDGNDFEILSGDYTFSNLPFVLGSFTLPSLGFNADNLWWNHIIDLSGVNPALEKQIRVAYQDLTTEFFTGLEVQKDPNGEVIANMSARESNFSGLQVGFSARKTNSGYYTADHYLFDNDILTDLAGYFVEESKVWEDYKYNIVDADNYKQHLKTLNGNGWEWETGIDKTAGVFTPGKKVLALTPTGIKSENLALLDFADDTAAAAGGVGLNELYHTSGTVKIRLV